MSAPVFTTTQTVFSVGYSRGLQFTGMQPVIRQICCGNTKVNLREANPKMTQVTTPMDANQRYYQTSSPSDKDVVFSAASANVNEVFKLGTVSLDTM